MQHVYDITELKNSLTPHVRVWDYHLQVRHLQFVIQGQLETLDLVLEFVFLFGLRPAFSLGGRADNLLLDFLYLLLGALESDRHDYFDRLLEGLVLQLLLEPSRLRGVKKIKKV